MKLRILLGLIIIIFSTCEDKEVVTDPLSGQINVFTFGGQIYNTTGGSYFLYDKIDGQFYYCFLVGTTGSHVFPKNVNDSYVVYGDYVRVFLQADSLDNILGSHDITTNENNAIIISGQTEKIGEGVLNLRTDLNDIKIIEIDARTDSGKKINLRAELTTLSIAYKIIRTVEGEFEHNSDSYDISQAFSSYNESQSKLTLGVQDESEAIGSQIVFYIDKTENTIPGIYLGNQSATENCFTGHISINNIIEDNQILQADFNEGTLQVEQDGENYSITFNIRTFSGYTITGHYTGEVLK
jgi:hypothetical protein